MPAFDEGRTIARVVAEAAAYADAVLVVDDGSSDDTAQAASLAGAVVVSHPENRGYGAALKTIFREADARRAAHLVVIDADGQHTAADIPRLVAAQRESSANVVIASRFTADAHTDAPRYRRFGLWVINTMTNLSLGAGRGDYISDAQSGFRAYDATAIASLAADDGIGDRMAASLDILYHAHRRGYSLAEVGTSITYDVEHASSQNPVTQGLELVAAILLTAARDRPLVGAGLPGLCCLLGGLLLAVALLGLLPAAGVLAAVTTAAASGLVALGVGLCSCAVIFHALFTRHAPASDLETRTDPETRGSPRGHTRTDD